ncbi:hypothetical protein ACFXDE_32025 [Kitasatospora sp. NPDC059408]|uniref:hypothetical protein n=1 Tax=Kitasatospora sp. NPDC059408 TaxID=3346823 RepID=UPI0036AE4E83
MIPAQAFGNVAGQALVPVIVAAREKALDLMAYNSPAGDLLDARDSAVVPAQAGAKAAAAA